MRWKLITLSAALITATSAQFLTIDNSVIIPVSKNGTINPEDHTETFAGDVEKDSNSINSTEYNAPPLTSTTFSIDSSAEDKEQENNILSPPNIPPDASPDYIRQTRETSEESKWDETSPSREYESNETPGSRDDSTMEASKSKEYGSTDEHSSSGNGSPEKPNTEEDTIEKSNSKESYEKPGSGEVMSTEKPGSNGTSDGSLAASSSDELTSVPGIESPQEPCPCDTGDAKMVQTSHGPVKGHIWHDTSEIISFIDIPYGKFIGSFEAPVTAQSWLDVHDATEHTKRCPQLRSEDVIGDTNCLTLSIFTPQNATNVSVLFHIHDGYSNIMSADPSKYGPEYLVPKGVILVLPNYRLGPMGFLCMQNETAPGNAAMKDLSLALEWVHENIRLFGGNPANIVVSGDGGAGAYAGYLALCSRSRHYINKVITESGSALSHLALDRDPIGTANKLADKIRSEHSNGTIYNNTFEEAALETIIKTAKGMRLNPCLENNKEPFMDDTPWKMLQDSDIDTTFMIGSASYAGTHEAMQTTVDFVEQLNSNFDQILPADLRFKNDVERKEFAQQLKSQYFKEENITLNHTQELSLWYTDASYLGPGIRLARPLLAAGATVYLYEFAFVGNLNSELESLNRPVLGAVRSDIVGYLFHKNGTATVQDSPEKQMIDLMVDLWVSFINTGKPKAENVEWNELKNAKDSEEEWLLISSEPKPKKGLHLDRLRLWTSLYNEHFIDHNSAHRFRPHYFLAIAAALMCWMANNKLNYSSH